MTKMNALRSWIKPLGRRRHNKPAPAARHVARLKLETLESRLPPGDVFHLSLSFGAVSSIANDEPTSSSTSDLSLIQLPPTTLPQFPSTSTGDNSSTSSTTTTQQHNNDNEVEANSPLDDLFFSNEEQEQAQFVPPQDTDDQPQNGSGGGAGGITDTSGIQTPTNTGGRFFNNHRTNDVSVPPPENVGPRNPVKIMGIRDVRGRRGLDLLTNDARPVVLGLGPAGQTITIYGTGGPLGQTTVNKFGKFAFQVPRRLNDGTYNLRAGLSFGRVPHDVQATLRLDTKAPGIRLTLTDFVRHGESATGFVQTFDTDKLGHLPEVLLDVDLDGNGKFTPNELGVIHLSKAGNFNFPQLDEGIYTVRARVKDEAGNVGIATSKIVFDPHAGLIGSHVLRQLGGIGFAESELGLEAHLTPLQLKDVEDAYYTAYKSIQIEARYTTPARADDFLRSLESLGFVYSHSTPSSNLISGYLPIDKIKELPNVPWFVAAAPVAKPVLRTGSVTTAGDAIIGADQFRAEQNVNGLGIMVGVISDSVNRVDGGIQDSVATGDLPAPPRLLVLQDGPAGSSDEGRAMLEIIHDIAPGSRLAFHSGFGGATNFANGIYALADAGAKVIVDDIGYLNSPLFNAGRMGKAIDDVSRRNGVFYATATGNDDDLAWRADWNPIQATVAGISGTFQRFGHDALQSFLLPAGETIRINFGWDSPYLEGGDPSPRFQVPNNLDVFLIDTSTDTIVAASTTINQQTDEAHEAIVYTSGGDPETLAFAIRLVSGPAPRRLGWISLGSTVTTLNAEEEGATTIFGQLLAERAMATAAADAANNGRVVNQFSSLGGLIDVVADDQGRRYPTAHFRRKPDVTAPDNVRTTFFAPPGVGDPPQFFFPGTSAAAPHVAGAAALLMQQQPRATNFTIAEHLRQTALDIGRPGFDPKAGFGLIQLVPIRSIPSRLSGPLGLLEPNQTSDQAVDMRWVGRDGFTQVGLAIRNTILGLPDYDWFVFSAANNGRVAVKQDNPYLEMNLYLSIGSTLVPIRNGIRVTAGQRIFVEVKGRQVAPGKFLQGRYSLFLRVV